MKKIITLLSMLVLMLTLTACGGKDTADDPNLGVYEARTGESMGIEMSVGDIFGDGFSIELKKKGKGKAHCDGDDYSIKWELEGDKFHAEGGGAELDGTLKDGVMVLEDVLGSGVTLTLVNDEYDAGTSASADDDEKDDDSSKDNDEDNDKDDDKDKDDAKDADDDAGAANISGSLGKLDDGEGGSYDLYMIVQDGKTYMPSDLEEKGITGYVQMKTDGTGTVKLGDHVFEMTWGNGKITVPEGEDGEEEYTYSFANEYLVIPDGDTVMTFMKSDQGDSGNSADADDSGDSGDSGNKKNTALTDSIFGQ